MGALLGIPAMLRGCRRLLLRRFLDYTHAGHQAKEVRRSLQHGKPVIYVGVRAGNWPYAVTLYAHDLDLCFWLQLRNTGRTHGTPQTHHVQRTPAFYSGMAG